MLQIALSARRLSLWLGAILLFCIWFSYVDPRYARSQSAEPSLPHEFTFASDSLFPVMHNPSRSTWLLEELRPLMAKFPVHAPFRRLAFWGLANSGAPTAVLTSLTDSLVAGVFPNGHRDPPGDLQRATHCLELAEVLIGRGEDLSTAKVYVQKAQQLKVPWQSDIRARCDADLALIKYVDGERDSVLRSGARRAEHAATVIADSVWLWVEVRNSIQPHEEIAFATVRFGLPRRAVWADENGQARLRVLPGVAYVWAGAVGFEPKDTILVVNSARPESLRIWIRSRDEVHYSESGADTLRRKRPPPE